MKVMMYKLLAKVFKRYKITYGVDFAYGVDHACDVTAIVNIRTGKKKVISCKYHNERIG